MKIIPGAIVGKISGSLGGMTAAHGRGGYYLRNRVKPVNPNTPRQQAVRSSLGALVQGWSSLLSAPQRAGWSAYAEATPRTDRLGETLLLTGSQAYVASNTPRLQLNASGLGVTAARIDDPPTIPTQGEPVTGVQEFEVAPGEPLSGSLTVTLAVPASDDGTVLVYIGSKLMSAGERSYTGPYQLAAAAAISANDVSEVITISNFAAPEHWAASIVPGVGDVVALRIVISYDDGRLSQEWRGLIEVEEGV